MTQNQSKLLDKLIAKYAKVSTTQTAPGVYTHTYSPLIRRDYLKEYFEVSK